MKKVILHADLNCFYASVEMLYQPSLRNVPLVVGGDSEQRKGIVLTKNKIAKQYNIKTGEPLWQVKQKCPNIVIIKADFEKYIRYSKQVKSIYCRYSDQVESFGIDEAWIDVSYLTKKIPAEQIAQNIINAVYLELGLTISVGIANNKVYAKLASDLIGENQYYTLFDNEKDEKVFNLPVNNLLYVGNSTNTKLKLLGILTIGDLAKFDANILSKYLGKNAYTLYSLANGYDTQIVQLFTHEIPFKSIGNSTTCKRNLFTLDDVKIIFTVLAESVSARLKENNVFGNQIRISVRTKELGVSSTQCQLDESTNCSNTLIENAMLLFKHHYNLDIPIRSLGISVSKLVSIKCGNQLNIFESFEKSIKDEAIDEAMLEIRKRFGHYKVSRALLLVDKNLSNFNPKDDHTIHPVGYFK